MTEPTRLLSAATTDFERSLLEAARDERPTAELDAHMLGALTVAGLAGGAALVGTSSASAVGSAAIRSSTVASAGSWSTLGKWGAGLIGLGAVALASFALSGTEPEVARESPRAVPPPAQAVLPSLVTNLPAPTVSDPAAPPDPARVRPSARKRAAVEPAPPSRAPTSSAAVDPLRDEIALLERTRTALAEGRADDALALLGKYERRHPSGQLAQEATVLRVRALEARGKGAQASRLAEEFLEKNPSSAHAPRIESARGATP